MPFLVLESLKGHVSSCPKHMRAIMFEDLLQMI